LDKTVKVVGSLIDIDSTWTKNLTSISNSNVTLAENDNDIANQFTDDKSNFYFDYELTSGNTYLLKDDSYKEIKKPKTESDTLTIIVPLTKDSLVVMNDSIYPPEDILFKGLLNSDGKKLSNVSLKLYQGDSLQALAKSDGMGMFSFPINTAEPKYTIFASKPGYESREIDINALDFRGKVPSIVRIEMVEKERIDVSGVVKSKDSVVANAQLDIFCDIESTKSQITDNSGSFKFSVNPDGEYSMMVNKKGYLPTKVDIPLENINENGDLDLAIELDTLKINQVFTMNIYYEFDKSDIKPKSEIELDRFISFMRINPSVKIEISAHTDEKGTDQYNMSLSRERANKVMNYLIYEGKVEKKRIISNGYGESKLIIKNAKTEEENQMNRRTEIRILGF
jgi:outer membrane protein OmpA-like peptidoglycan-associated protein